MKNNTDIAEFVKLVEDVDCREVLTNFLLEMYFYACPAKALGKLFKITISMKDNLMLEWYFEDTRKFILEAFKKIPVCEWSEECIFYYGIIKNDDDLIIREPLPDREDIMHLNLIETIINGFLHGGWNCTKIKDGIFRYGSQDLMFNIFNNDNEFLTGYDKTLKDMRKKVDEYLKKK
jgi:hypothetical protein